LSAQVKVLFASARTETMAAVLENFRRISPELPLIVVSEFPAPEGEWIPYHPRRSWRENRELIRDRLAGRRIRIAAVILEPRVPYRRLRALGVSLAPWRCLFFNETGSHFMLRPRSLPVILRHGLWRIKNFLRTQLHPKSRLRRLLRGQVRLPLLYRAALLRGRWLQHARGVAPDRPVRPGARPDGVSVVIPSRNGRPLLELCLPGLADASEIIVVDNGSEDGTAAWLGAAYPGAILESSPEPLPFAMAANRGVARARFSHVCVLNNDMLVEPGFLAALRRPFAAVPDLFCSTAQIFFPEGRRREETGKTALNPSPAAEEFPVRCDVPLEGEDHTYVLYGSGGCSLYDAAKLEALGGFDEAYVPAYVEDLDLGVRAWLRGWPSVYAAGARVLHQHRATTSRYFTPQELELALETNYARFLARVIGEPERFARMWGQHVRRLRALENAAALANVSRIPAAPVPSGDLRVLDMLNGQVAVFPGREPSGKPRVLVASPYLPFPLAHGGAVRIFNLMRQAARDFDQILVAFTEQPRPAPPELRELCVEVVTVHRPGTHAPPSRGRPDTVEEFDSPAFHAVLRQTVARWKPGVAQLEFTQMAQYAPDCAPAKTILVEHDITFDLYAQLLARPETSGYETRRQHELWKRFETAAWRQVDRVVTMSDQDRARIAGAVTIPNGVDLDRFQPSETVPEPRRLLFIGSFRHRPNVLAVRFFLREVFPKLRDVTLHVIAGPEHERFWDLRHAGVEVQGFVADVRPAYRRAAVVIAPLVASAGTNVKILEAMAMGKAIVSTEAGIHGLTLERGRDLIVTNDPAAMAAAIARLLEDRAARAELERRARLTVEQRYGWDAIAREQRALYEGL
jgi:GT2 family glycosyltransferase/glycosyltransferase involved in cell wall biosynthesis